ncbi:MAG: hypothetical protein A2504_12750 [Bdellovibrionales bacterium RIFOXYD12_FULL_39_22]|nr:MAG: hypothetical protein A2385_03835 [Bdellovibrionales bacterium RIFOXYB1_FULL_39_21]OFZ40483.1 MAG: hypothetical protein A2485_02700 [Bdellovibrionales bacterium RIFOXYC12_FULL_39_17]OFZ49966.1 MAG: hypothetical protein A2404_02035 [Bdellovibrionales bacterium RIFOXYC1_FULL_39_130]OFZ77608.1 MAG: hypothetical protein A2560_04595 [Bdellovibrionales bacterium RIFOXYD1_FULL_39_84]OFZ96062.1 MAG: hypothetical protein A2504_12750 [Bdellovibrionales bacterium RIFOXYD12_FULL_39_22]HLE10649.1 ac
MEDDKHQQAEFVYEMQILERHLDSLGHVNNATYLEIYEEARWDILTKSDRGVDYIQKNKIGPVVLDLQITYKKELRNREQIQVKSHFVGHKNKLVMSFHQEIYNRENQLVSNIDLSIGVMDLEKRKLVTPSADWIAAIGGAS